jgi:hypothetical protein
MRRLNPARLHTRLLTDAGPDGPFLPRRYTLTHSDRTGDLFLTIGTEYDREQISGWYTRLMRDEVLAEWCEDGDALQLHVHCHVSGGLVLGRAAWRAAIFRRELPLVLEALSYGDREVLAVRPELVRAKVIVHFHAARDDLDRAEEWGLVGDYG